MKCGVGGVIKSSEKHSNLKTASLKNFSKTTIVLSHTKKKCSEFASENMLYIIEFTQMKEVLVSKLYV